MSWFKSKMLGLVATIGLSGGVASAQEASQSDDVGAKNKQTEMTTTPKKQTVGECTEQIDINQKVYEQKVKEHYDHMLDPQRFYEYMRNDPVLKKDYDYKRNDPDDNDVTVGECIEQIVINQKLNEHIRNNPEARKKFSDVYDNNFDALKNNIMGGRWQEFNSAEEYTANLITQFVYGFSQEQIENNQKLWENIKNNPENRKKFLDAYDNNFAAHKDSIMAVRWQKFNDAKEYIANLIAQFEAFRAHAYWDPKGRCWTVGYGNTIMPDGSKVTAACVIRTPQEGLSMLLGHVEKDANRIIEHIPLELAKCDQEVAAIFSGCYNFGTGPFVGKDGKRTTLTEDAICFFSLRTEGAKEAFAERFRAHCKSSGKREQVLYERRCFEEQLLGYTDQKTGDFVICIVPLEQLKYSQLGSVYAAKGDPSLMASICQSRYCGEGGMRRAVNEQLSQMDRRHTYAASKQSVRKAQAKAEKYAAKKKNKSSGAKSTAKTGSKASKPTNSSAPKSKMRTQARSGRGGR